LRAIKLKFNELKLVQSAEQLHKARGCGLTRSVTHLCGNWELTISEI